MSRPHLLRLPRLLPALLLACITLGGCSQIDPYKREGVWKPEGVNETNLAAMVVDPTELWWGRERTTGTLRTGTRAVERLWQGPQGQRSAQGGGGSQGGGAQGGSTETTR